MSLATALLALVPLAIRAKAAPAAEREPGLVEALAERDALREALERARRTIYELRQREASPYQQGLANQVAAGAYQQMAAQQQLTQAMAMQNAQNAFAFYGESFGQICDCSPPHGRAGLLTGLGGLGA